jgi:hypothetical protein
VQAVIALIVLPAPDDEVPREEHSSGCLNMHGCTAMALADSLSRCWLLLHAALSCLAGTLLSSTAAAAAGAWTQATAAAATAQRKNKARILTAQCRVQRRAQQQQQVLCSSGFGQGMAWSAFRYQTPDAYVQWQWRMQLRTLSWHAVCVHLTGFRRQSCLCCTSKHSHMLLVQVIDRAVAWTIVQSSRVAHPHHTLLPNCCCASRSWMMAPV